MATQHEEISARIGLDSSSFAKGLGGLRRQLDSFASNVTSKFKSLSGSIGAGIVGALSIAGLSSVASKLAEFAESITTTAKNVGVTTDFLQGFIDAAEKSGVSGEKATTGLEKFVAKLRETGSAASVDQAVFDLADKMAAVADPAARAKIAVDALGKSGVEMAGFLSKGSAELRQLIADADKLSGDHIESIRQAKVELDDLKQRGLIATGTAVGAGLGTADVLKEFRKREGTLKTIGLASPVFGPLIAEGHKKEVIDSFKAVAAQRNARDAVAKAAAAAAESEAKAAADIAKQRDLQDALTDLEKIQEQMRVKKLTEEERLAELINQRTALEISTANQALVTSEATKERAKALKELLDVQRQIETSEKNIELSQIQQAQNEIALAKLKIQLAGAIAGRNTTREDSAKFTLQELAAGNPSGVTGQLRQDIFSARNVLRLEQLAERQKFAGFGDKSLQTRDFANNIRDAITNLKSTEKGFDAKAKADIAGILQQIAELNAAAKGQNGTGLIISPRNGP